MLIITHYSYILNLISINFLYIKCLSETQATLVPITQYYFVGEGKAIRPVITVCLAKAINYHLNVTSPYAFFLFCFHLIIYVIDYITALMYRLF